MMDSDIGKFMCVAVAALPNLGYSHDVIPSSITYPELLTDEILIMYDNYCLAISDYIDNSVKPDMRKMVGKIAIEAHTEQK